MKKWCCSVALLSFLMLGPAQARPSVVILDSGEQLIGDVLDGSSEEVLVLRSGILGEVQVPRARVLSIEPQELEGDLETAVPVAREVRDAELAAQAEEQKILDAVRGFKTPEYWNGSLRLGMNLSHGDTRWTETYANGKLEIKPLQSASYYRFAGSSTYRETERSDGTDYKSTDKYDAEFTFRHSFLEDWFFQSALGYRADHIKGIDSEAQATVGIGYRYKPTDNFEMLLGGSGGAEELIADYEDTRRGLNPLANIFQETTWSPLSRTTLIQKFNYYWNPEAGEQFNYVLSLAIRVRLTDLLGFEFSFNKSFDNDVGDGNAKDDTQWRNAMVFYF